MLGVAAGAVGVGFSKILYWIEDACDWAWRWPEWARPAVGGLLLGGVLLVLPEMYGVGYPVLENAVAGKYAIGFLLVLLVGKIVATSLTIGIGGSGGVFAPSLFMGAMLGSAFGLAAHDVFGASARRPVGSYALVGMGAVFAGAARAPITAVVIMFELTGEYSIILPLMAAIVLATLTSRLLTGDTIYTLKLRRRGIDLASPAPARPVRWPITLVAQVMEPVPAPLSGDAEPWRRPRTLWPAPGTAPCRWPTPTAGTWASSPPARSPRPWTPTSRARSPSAPCSRRPEAVTADTTLHDALRPLLGSGGTGVPVLAPDTGELTGWITHQNLLAALHRPGVARAVPAAGPVSR